MADHVESERIRELNDLPIRDGRPFVLYLMEASQRTRDNQALDYALGVANRLGSPLVVAFCLTPDIPDATTRSLCFMLDGLREIADDLSARSIRFHLMEGELLRMLAPLLSKASMVVVDRGYLRHQVAWRHSISRHAECRVLEVEANVVVPVDLVSRKREYAARTIRPKLTSKVDQFLVRGIPGRPVAQRYGGELPGGRDPNLIGPRDLKWIDRSVAAIDTVRGGMGRAYELLESFASAKIDRFAEDRNDPLADVNTELSPYLRFGQISPIEIMLRVKRSRTADHPGILALQEELIVRRELSCNFVRFEPEYDRFTALPEWAQKTLGEHRDDDRDYDYSFDQFDSAATNDPYWNSTMREMKQTGRMRGYMRMYWGKKVLEWSRSPEVAFDTLISLNNRYFLDGGDPNSWANVAWIFGNHDRPWQERPIYGKVRYMNANGLRRKFDIERYVELFDSEG